MILGAAYLWEERYFFRYLPIPHEAIDILYEIDGTLPLFYPDGTGRSVEISEL